LGIKCAKPHSNSFRCDIFIARYVGGHFFLRHTVYLSHVGNNHPDEKMPLGDSDKQEKPVNESF